MQAEAIAVTRVCEICGRTYDTTLATMRGLLHHLCHTCTCRMEALNDSLCELLDDIEQDWNQ